MSAFKKKPRPFKVRLPTVKNHIFKVQCLTTDGVKYLAISATSPEAARAYAKAKLGEGVTIGRTHKIG